MIDMMPEPETLPKSYESERVVLSSALLDPSILPTISGRLRAEDFFDERHQILYRAMLDLHEEAGEIDLQTLQVKLEQRGQLESVGGLAYLTGLDLDLPDIGRVDTHVEILKEHSVRRQLIQMSGQVLRNCLDSELETVEVVGRAERAILDLKEGTIHPDFARVSTVLHSTLQDMEERADLSLTGLPTGFLDFDRLTGGLHKGNLIIIAGRPGMGKTSFALNVAQHVAIRERKPVGIFSLEMSQQELALRILCSESDISFSRLRANRVSQKEWIRIIQTVRAIGDAPLFIDDSANLTLSKVESKARRLKKERELEVLFLDCLQLMNSDGKYDNRSLELAAIIRGLKHLAKDLEISVIVASGLPPAESFKVRRPQLSDLGEESNLDEDADVVILIHREALGRTTLENKRLAELIVAKQRNGETGTLDFVFLEEITTFRSLLPPEAKPDGETAANFQEWIGLARQVPENPNPKFRSDDDLWN